MDIYVIASSSKFYSEQTYAFCEQKAYHTKDEALEGLRQVVDNYWKEATERDESLANVDVEQFYNGEDEFFHEDKYSDEYAFRVCQIQLDITSAELALEDAYRYGLSDLLQTYVPGYSSCRLAILDMRGMCLSFDYGDPTSKYYVDFVAGLPDGTQTIGGHTVKDNITCSPKKYFYMYDGRNEEGCSLNLMELKQLHDRANEAFKSDRRRLRAWNPFWMVANSVNNLCQTVLDEPYDKYLEDVKNDKKKS